MRAASGRSPGEAGDELVIRRTPRGWRVGGAHLSDLLSAMVFADLLAAEKTADATASAGPTPPRRPVRPADPLTDEAARLRVTVAQLEHALASRVTIEQAIGVLTERHRISPRRAFERLRQAARSRGRRVHELACEVVASATNPLLPIPPELSRTPPAR